MKDASSELIAAASLTFSSHWHSSYAAAAVATASATHVHDKHGHIAGQMLHGVEAPIGVGGVRVAEECRRGGRVQARRVERLGVVGQVCAEVAERRLEHAQEELGEKKSRLVRVLAAAHVVVVVVAEAGRVVVSRGGRRRRAYAVRAAGCRRARGTRGRRMLTRSTRSRPRRRCLRRRRRC